MEMMDSDATGSPTGGRRRAAATCVLIAVAAAACQDSPTDPLSTLVSDETVPALDVALALPSLPELVELTGTRAELAGAVADWGGSWLGDTSVEAREAAVSLASPVLARALGRAGVTQVLDPVHRVAGSLDRLEGLPPGIVDAISQVRIDAGASEAALAAGDVAIALERGLRASDRLRAAGPEALAQGLVARAERVLAQVASTDDGASGTDDGRPLDEDRARRLLTGARESLETGDALQALRQAYYACQILEGATVR